MSQSVGGWGSLLRGCSLHIDWASGWLPCFSYTPGTLSSEGPVAKREIALGGMVRLLNARPQWRLHPFLENSTALPQSHGPTYRQTKLGNMEDHTDTWWAVTASATASFSRPSVASGFHNLLAYAKLTDPPRDAPERKCRNLPSSLLTRSFHDVTQRVSLLMQKSVSPGHGSLHCLYLTKSFFQGLLHEDRFSSAHNDYFLCKEPYLVPSILPY